MTLRYIGIIFTLVLSPCWSDPVIPESLGGPALAAAVDEEWAGPEGLFRTPRFVGDRARGRLVRT